MTVTIQTTNRLAPQANEVIDRTKTIHFTFAGERFTAHPGDTIASALTAAGVKLVARSFKYHRPRGLMAYGHAMNTMVQIGNEPSISAWLRPVEDGMVVEPVNARPSLQNDFMSLTQMGDRFLPVGFYYKTFIRPAFMWPVYESVLRRLAGLGKIDIKAKLTPGYDKQYLHGDVVVVGAGPAGLSAAITAAKAGVRVLLIDDGPHLGGHLRYSNDGSAHLTELINEAAQFPNLKTYNDTTVTHINEEGWMAAVSGKRFYKIRAQTMIYATGAIDQPLVFANNDLPGIMMGSAVQRLLNMHSVTTGQRILIVTANEDGWQLAADLHAAGVTVIGVVDERRGTNSPVAEELEHAGITAYWNHTIVKANGKNEVEGAQIALLSADRTPDMLTSKQVTCDTIAISTSWAPDNGLLYQAGAKIEYDHDRREFLPQTLPDKVFAAGRVNGAHSDTLEVAEGVLAGQQAIAALGHGEAPDTAAFEAIETMKAKQPRRTSDLVLVESDGKLFVDFDEDVTYKDVKDAIAEGYHSIELLKRYSTISMGPSQGKWSSLNTIHLTSRINGWSIEETGTTTGRPPYRPLEMRALGGQMMEPVRYTAIHDWHIKNGAKMMDAGLWERPEHYGDPTAEVHAVRHNVGLIDVSTLGKLKFTGPGVPELLNKLYINKWSKLKVGRVRYGAMCSTEGVITDDGVTARVGEQEWYTSTTSGGAAAVFENAQWWMQSGWGEGVHLTSMTEELSAFNLAGPKSRQLLETLLTQDGAEALSNESFPYMQTRDIELAGIACRLMRIGFTGELSYEIHVATGYAQYLWESIMEAGEAFGIRPFGVEAQRILRLEKAHIIIGQDTDALTDPLMADMAWAAKLDKADFLGQRAITKAAENGITQKLVGFKMKDKVTVPEEGLQIVSTTAKCDAHPLGLKIIGWVCSSRFSPTLNEVIGLCWLPVEAAENLGSTFNIRRNGELIKGEVHHGAFYDPTGGKLKG